MSVRALAARVATLAFSLALPLSRADATQAPLHSPDVTPEHCVPGETPDYVQRLLRVVVNGTDSRKEPLFLQRPCGALLMRIPDVEAQRMRTAGKPVVVIDGEPYLNLNDYDGLTYDLDEAKQVVSIEGDPSIFMPTIIDFERKPAPPPTAAALGAFLNYGFFGSGTPGTEDPAYSASAGLGVFKDERILLSDWLYFRQDGLQHTYRLDTTLVQDFVDRVSTLRLGDVVTRGSTWGGGAAVGGIQYGTNFDTRPYMTITPVQVIDATTSQTAGMDLYMNSQDPERASRSVYLSGLTTVPHGPVELINVPTYNNGEYELLLRDSLGREVLVRQPFFFNSGLLRTGLHDFSYEAGARRRNSVGEDYDGGLASATHRYGFSNSFTGEAQAAVSDHGGAAGLTALVSVPHAGVLAVTGAGSQSDLVSGTGALGAVSLENRFERYAFALREDCQTADFVLPTVDVLPASSPICRSVGALSFGLPLNMSLGLSAAHVDNRGTDDSTSARVGLTTRPWPLAQLTLFAGWTKSTVEDVSAGLFISTSLAPFTRGSPRQAVAGFEAQRTQFSATAFGGDAGVTASEARLSTGQDYGDTAFGAQAASTMTGPARQTLTLTAAAPRLNVVGGVQSNEGRDSYSAGATGALAYLDRAWILTRPLYSSFALVRLGPENAGVRVNGLRSDADGDVLVAPLQAYALNPVAINGSDLPMNARVDGLTQGVTPRWRAGVVVRPRIERVREAMVTVHLRDANGAEVPLPEGAFATIAGKGERFPTGEDGAVYLAGLDPRSTVTITYREHSCELTLDVPEVPERDAIPELGPFLCEGVAP